MEHQLNIELRNSHSEQEQRLQDMHLENMHLHAVQVEQLMQNEEKQRTVQLLFEARSELLSLRKQYDEDMLEVQGLSKILQLRIFGLQEELSQLKEGGNKLVN
jgi:hypothetical protein